MTIHLDLLAATLLTCAACAEGTEPDLLKASPPNATSAPTTASPTPTAAPSATETAAPPPPPQSQEVAGAYSLDVSCADILGVCLVARHADKDVVFVLPSGMKRGSILFTVDPEGSDANGSVDWAGQDDLDGTVHMQGFAGPFSSVHIAVTGVMAVPQ